MLQRPAIKVDNPSASRAVWSLVEILADHVRLDNVGVARIANDKLVFLVLGEREAEAKH